MEQYLVHDFLFDLCTNSNSVEPKKDEIFQSKRIWRQIWD